MAPSSRPTGQNNHPNRKPSNGTRGRALDEGPRRRKGRPPRSVSHHTASNSDTNAYRPRQTNSNNHRYKHANTKNGREEPRRGPEEHGWQQVGQDRWGDLLAELHRVTEMLGQLTRQLQARVPSPWQTPERNPPPLRDDNPWRPLRHAATQGSRSIGLEPPSRNPPTTPPRARERDTPRVQRKSGHGSSAEEPHLWTGGAKPRNFRRPKTPGHPSLPSSSTQLPPTNTPRGKRGTDAGNRGHPTTG